MVQICSEKYANDKSMKLLTGLHLCSRGGAAVPAELHHSIRSWIGVVRHCSIGDSASGWCWFWTPVPRFHPSLRRASRQLSWHCGDDRSRLPQYVFLWFPGSPSVSFRQRANDRYARPVLQQRGQRLSCQHLSQLSAQAAPRGRSLQGFFASVSGQVTAQNSLQVSVLFVKQ